MGFRRRNKHFLIISEEQELEQVWLATLSSVSYEDEVKLSTLHSHLKWRHWDWSSEHKFIWVVFDSLGTQRGLGETYPKGCFPQSNQSKSASTRNGPQMEVPSLLDHLVSEAIFHYPARFCKSRPHFSRADHMGHMNNRRGDCWCLF